MNLQIVRITMLTFVWMFVAYQLASLGAALMSVYPSDPLFLRLVSLVILAAVAATLTSIGTVWGWFFGVLYTIASVSNAAWQIFHSDRAWRPSLLRGIAADLVFGAALYMSAKSSARKQTENLR